MGQGPPRDHDDELAQAATAAGGDGAPRADLATLDASVAVPTAVGPASRLARVDRGRYRVDVEVARGGLGRVLRARDLHLDRDVALKEMLAGGEAGERRFVRETLIPVHDAGRDRDGQPFYAMKLVRGRPLSEAIAGAITPAARVALVPTVLAIADGNLVLAAPFREIRGPVLPTP